MPTRDRPDKLRRCLASLRTALGERDELLVVDSASRDAATIEAIARESDGLYLRAATPGVNVARNLGWRHARHDLVAFVDDDVAVEDGWADAFARSAEAQPEAAFITGRLSPMNDSAHGDVAVKDDGVGAVLTRVTRGDLGHGANLLVRRWALEAVRGWDEALGVGARFGSAPEADLYDRLFLAGHEGRYEPAARGFHEQWRSPGELVRLDFRYGYGNGARLAKLARTDRARARQVGAEALWGWGAQRLGAALRDRHKTEVARVLARLVGTALGFVRGLSNRVRDGHYE